MKLNLGCGTNWQEAYPDYEGLDRIDFGQKYVVDIFDFLSTSTQSYDTVLANHFLEHFDQDELKKLFKGIYILLTKDGTFRFVVPHKDKREKAWVLAHKTFWNEETVRWLLRDDAESVYGFGNWELIELITNEKGDIHAELKKI